MSDDNHEFLTGPVFENGPKYVFNQFAKISIAPDISVFTNQHDSNQLVQNNTSNKTNNLIKVNSPFEKNNLVLNNQKKTISAKITSNISSNNIKNIHQQETQTTNNKSSSNNVFKNNLNFSNNINEENKKSQGKISGKVIINKNNTNNNRNNPKVVSQKEAIIYHPKTQTFSQNNQSIQISQSVNINQDTQNIQNNQNSKNIGEQYRPLEIEKRNKVQPPIIPEDLREYYFNKRQNVLSLYADGKFLEAVTSLLELINESKLAGHLDAEDFVLMATVMHAMKQSRASVDALSECLRYKPDDVGVLRNYATALQFNNQYAEAIDVLHKVVAKGQVKYSDYDGLAAAYGELGKLNEAKNFGSLALKLRAEELAINSPSSWVPPTRKAFNPENVNKNVISFSLWGHKPRYIESAIENAIAMPYIYPSWRARFYCDESVPAYTIAKLTELGAEIFMQPKNRSYEGLFWRFAVANDPNVDFFLVRDADSIINVQERVAVDEWLASDRLFHVMRDYFTHSELILAGLWGGQANVLPNIIDLANAYRSSELFTRTIDQNILRDCIWPMVEKSVMVHDSQFNFADSRPFPAYGKLPPGKHVGQSKRA